MDDLEWLRPIEDALSKLSDDEHAKFELMYSDELKAACDDGDIGKILHAIEAWSGVGIDANQLTSAFIQAKSYIIDSDGVRHRVDDVEVSIQLRLMELGARELSKWKARLLSGPYVFAVGYSVEFQIKELTMRGDSGSD